MDCKSTNIPPKGSRMANDNNFCVIIGDPIDGITVYGPFLSGVDAMEWAEQFVSGTQNWWVTELHSDITMAAYQ